MVPKAPPRETAKYRKIIPILIATESTIMLSTYAESTVLKDVGV